MELYADSQLGLLWSSNTPSREPPLDLMRLHDLHSKIFRELPNQSGVLLEVPTDEADVRLVLVQNPLSHMPVVDPADGGDDDLIAESGFDGSRKVSLERRGILQRQILESVDACGGDVDEVDAVFCENLGELDAVGYFP